jgi:hypothetical protein
MCFSEKIIDAVLLLRATEDDVVMYDVDARRSSRHTLDYPWFSVVGLAISEPRTFRDGDIIEATNY